MNNIIYLNIWETTDEKISRLIRLRRQTTDPELEDKINEELTRLYSIRYQHIIERRKK